MTADLEVREPRCRVCRNETVRRRVNELLQWRGVPVFLPGGKTRKISLAEILRSLEPLNEGSDRSDQITYDSLWVHAQRHYEVAGAAAYWAARIRREFRDALGAKDCRKPIATVQCSN